MWRDVGCVIARCNSRYRFQVHHVKHRGHGGTNDPDNLATLCWFHHHVVIHGTGLHLDPDSSQQKRTFLRACAAGTDPPSA